MYRDDVLMVGLGMFGGLGERERNLLCTILPVTQHRMAGLNQAIERS